MYKKLRTCVLALAATLLMPFAASATTIHAFDLDDCSGICDIDPAQADGFQFTVVGIVTNFWVYLARHRI